MKSPMSANVNAFVLEQAKAPAISVVTCDYLELINSDFNCFVNWPLPHPICAAKQLSERKTQRLPSRR